MFSPFTAWLPGGATISQPCIRWPRPLTEPDLRISRIWLFKQVHSLSADSRFGFGDNIITRTLCPVLFPLLDTPACQPLPSTGITRLQRYHELIRLPIRHLACNDGLVAAFSVLNHLGSLHNIRIFGAEHLHAFALRPAVALFTFHPYDYPYKCKTRSDGRLTLSG